MTSILITSRHLQLAFFILIKILHFQQLKFYLCVAHRQMALKVWGGGLPVSDKLLMVYVTAALLPLSIYGVYCEYSIG